MKFKDILKTADFDWNKVEANPDSGTTLHFEFEINPEDFLEFAEKDLENNEIRSYVNSLSNAKRAIDCTCEKIIKIFSLKPKYNNLPSKLDLISDLGIVAPRIINKVNRIRNFLEHEYKKPSKDKVEDAIDIANLFVSSANGVLRSVWSDFYIEEEDNDSNGNLDNCIYFSFDEFKREISATLYKNEIKQHCILTSNDDYYKTIVKIMLSEGTGRISEKKAILDLKNII